MPDKSPLPEATESVDEHLAQATPEQVARAIFAAVAPPDPRKQRPMAERNPVTS